MKLPGDFNLLYSDRKQVSGCLGPGMRREKRETSGVMETSYILTVVVVWVYAFVKALGTVHFKCVHFVINELYLSQLGLKVYELSCTHLLISCNPPALSCLSYLL